MAGTIVPKLLSPSGSRLFSTPPSEDMMPFYCLGVSVATQVGGELKGLLEKKEIDAVLAGFNATMLNELTEHDKSLMQTYGPKISSLLQDRAKNVIGNEKKKGSGKCYSVCISDSTNHRTIPTPSSHVL